MTEADRLARVADVPHQLAELTVMEANRRDLTLRNLRADCRLRHLVAARWAIAGEARRHGFSYPQIGRALNRDHSTIVHAVKRLERLADHG